MSEKQRNGGKKGGTRASEVLNRRQERLRATTERGGSVTHGDQADADRSTETDASVGRTGAEAPASTTTGRRRRPVKPVRITVDLDPERHRFLRQFALDADAKGTAVLRGLLDLLSEDEALAERLRAKIEGPTR